MTTGTAPRPGGRDVPAAVLVVLAGCGGFAPFGIDAYLAGLPEIASELAAPAWQVQLTLTGFTLMLGLLQLVVGPLSDQTGRRRLLLLGTAGAAAASVLCALAPGIVTLVVARLLQGALGAAGVVLARAVVADLSSGPALARSFALLASVQSVAPVVAPVVGGSLVGALGWRSVFWFLAALAAALCLAVHRLVPESLPAGRRRAGGVRSALADMAALLRHRPYRSAVAMFVCAFGVMFAYIAGSAFVLQRVVGLSPGAYTVVFAVNSATLVVASLVSGRVLRGRVTPVRVITAAATALCLAVAWLAVSVLAFGTPGWAVIGGFFVLVASNGFLFPSLSALALGAAGARTGSGSALMGAAQMGLASVVAPLTGLGDGRSAVPMVVVMLVTAGGLLLALRALRRPGRDAGPA